jgi:NAD(P)-dependent dehydrogenase (short-subunit alcohol dehydrogenase family)
MPADTPKVAIVTGGSQGIGAGLVDAYRQRGYNLVATSRSITPSDQSDVVTVAGDIADPATSDAVVKAALDRFGRIDTLINNAGIFIAKPFTDYTAEDYHRILATNVNGFFNITHRTVPHLLDSGDGHIVTITTTLANTPTPGSRQYSHR